MKSYRVSRARRQFEENAAFARRALRHGSSALELDQFLVSSVIAYCITALELYIETVVTDWIEALNSQRISCDSLPIPVLCFAALEDANLSPFRRFLVTGDETAFLQEFSRRLSSGHYAFAARSTGHHHRVNCNALLSRKYPSPENVEKTFARVGIPKVFNRISEIANSDAKALLQAINDRRTQIVHEGAVGTFTRGDAREALADASVIVKGIDRVLHRHVCETTGASSWQS